MRIDPVVLLPNFSALLAGSVVFFLRLPLLDFLQSSRIAGSLYYVALVASPLLGVIAATIRSGGDNDAERQLIRSYVLATALGLVFITMAGLTGAVNDGLIPRSTGGEQVYASILAIGLLIATVVVPVVHPLIRTILTLIRRLRSTGS